MLDKTAYMKIVLPTNVTPEHEMALGRKVIEVLGNHGEVVVATENSSGMFSEALEKVIQDNKTKPISTGTL